MKILKWNIMIMVVIISVFTVFFCSLPLLAEGISTRRGIVQMKSGETGSTGGGSPPGPFGDHWVHLQNNAVVDSYNSCEGPYDESQGLEANVGCNVNPNDAAAGVSLDNNAIVKGDVSVTTSEESGDIINTNNSAITGNSNYDSAEWELLPINMPEWHTEGGGGPYGIIVGDLAENKVGGYWISNNNFQANNNADVTFRAGKYHFNNFELSNNVNFTIDPDIGEDEVVEIYVGTSIIFENNSELLPAIEFSGDTTKLRFYFDGTNTVDLSNNVEFYGFIYAPNAKIEIRNNDNIFGNLVGKEVWIWNNAGVHYDKCLLGEDFGNVFTGGIPAAPHKRTDWKEIIVSD